jgi:hypothetical protein
MEDDDIQVTEALLDTVEGKGHSKKISLLSISCNDIVLAH